MNRNEAIAHASQAERGQLGSLSLLLRSFIDGDVGNRLDTPAALGITSGVGALYKSSVRRSGDIITTRILFGLTGLSSSTTDLDIIGTGANPAHLGKITKAVNGTLFAGKVQCLELPATGVVDIDFYSAVEATGVFDGGIAALVERALLTNGGNWTLSTVKALTGLPADGEYLYATCGAGGVPAVYTAGKFLIELEGYAP